MISIQEILPVGYIDPGSGALLLQWIVAAVIGSGLFFRKAIGGVMKRIFGRQHSDSNESETGDDKEKKG